MLRTGRTPTPFYIYRQTVCIRSVVFPQPRVSFPVQRTLSSPGSSGRLDSPPASLCSDTLPDALTPRAPPSEAASTSSSRVFLTGLTRRCISLGSLSEDNAVEDDSLGSDFRCDSAEQQSCPKRRATGFSLVAGVLQTGSAVEGFCEGGKSRGSSAPTREYNVPPRAEDSGQLKLSSWSVASHARRPKRVRKSQAGRLVLASRQTSAIRRVVLVSFPRTAPRRQPKGEEREARRKGSLTRECEPSHSPGHQRPCCSVRPTTGWERQAISQFRMRRQSIVLTPRPSASRLPSCSRVSASRSPPCSLRAAWQQILHHGSEVGNTVTTTHSSPCRGWRACVSSSAAPWRTVPLPSPRTPPAHAPVAASVDSLPSRRFSQPHDSKVAQTVAAAPQVDRDLRSAVQLRKCYTSYRGVAFSEPSQSDTPHPHIPLSYSKPRPVANPVKEVCPPEMRGGRRLSRGLAFRRPALGYRAKFRRAAGRKVRRSRYRAYLLRRKGEGSPPLVGPVPGRQQLFSELPVLLCTCVWHSSSTALAALRTPVERWGRLFEAFGDVASSISF